MRAASAAVQFQYFTYLSQSPNFFLCLHKPFDYCFFCVTSRSACLVLYFLSLSDFPLQSCPMQLFVFTPKCLHSHLSCLSANTFTVHKFWKPRYQIDQAVCCPYSWQAAHLCPLKLFGSDNLTLAEVPLSWLLVTLMLELDSGKSLFLTRNMLTLFPYFLPHFDIILLTFLATQTVLKKTPWTEKENDGSREKLESWSK